MSSPADIEGFQALNGIVGRSDLVDGFFIFGATWVIFIMIALVLGYLLLSWKTTHWEGRFENVTHVGVTVTLAFIAEQLIGFFWFRARPFVDIEGVVKLIDMAETSKSFPSGHSTFAFALAFGLLIHNRRLGWSLVVLALFVGLSRIAVGVHYPSDVAGGLIVGVIAAVLTAPIKRRIEPLLDWIPFFRLYKRTKPAKDLL